MLTGCLDILFRNPELVSDVKIRLYLHSEVSLISVKRRMGNEISLQLRLPDRVTVPTTSNDSPRSPKTEICQTSQNIKAALPDSNNCLTLIEREKTVKDQNVSENRRTTMSAFIDIGQKIVKLEIEETATGYSPAQANDQGTETQNKFSSSRSDYGLQVKCFV